MSNAGGLKHHFLSLDRFHFGKLAFYFKKVLPKRPLLIFISKNCGGMECGHYAYSVFFYPTAPVSSYPDMFPNYFLCRDRAKAYYYSRFYYCNLISKIRNT